MKLKAAFSLSSYVIFGYDNLEPNSLTSTWVFILDDFAGLSLYKVSYFSISWDGLWFRLVSFMLIYLSKILFETSSFEFVTVGIFDIFTFRPLTPYENDVSQP